MDLTARSCRPTPRSIAALLVGLVGGAGGGGGADGPQMLTADMPPHLEDRP